MENEKKILQCHSRGDKRFSALCAKVVIHNRTYTIEKIYQWSKRKSDGTIAGKSKPFDYFVCPFCGMEFPAEEVSYLYKGLWIMYFNDRPDLLEYASGFDEFVDIFKGKSVNCQADVIAELVRDKEKVISEVKESDWYKTMARWINGIANLRQLGVCLSYNINNGVYANEAIPD